VAFQVDPGRAGNWSPQWPCRTRPIRCKIAFRARGGMGARIPGGNKPGVVWVICTEFPGSRACPQIEANPNGVDEQGGNGILIRLLGS
jgi:hypothetical protein